MFIKLGEFIKKYYKQILIVSALFTIISIFWVSKLKISTQMMDLLPADEPEIIMYQDAVKNFKGIDAVTIAVFGTEQNIKNYIEDIRHEIIKVPNVDKLIYKTEYDFLRKHGPILIKAGDLESLKDMFTASSIKDFIRGLNVNFEKEYISGEDEDKLSKDAQEILFSLNSIEDFFNILGSSEPSKSQIIESSDNFILGPKYMISPDRTAGIMFARTSVDIMDIENILPLVNNLEKLVKKNQDKYNVKAGVSGFIVIQRDEMETCTSDMKKSSVLSLILIMTIFIIGFRLFRYSILAGLTLITGIIWAMGITYLLLGRLNIFTAMMGAILIGLGIDYAIHIIAIFTEERLHGKDSEQAVSGVFKKTIKGVVTGSITTAIGFVTFILSSFPGFKEFGITLGIGILSVLVCSVFVLPSLILVFGHTGFSTKLHTISPLMRLYEKIVLQKPWFVILFISMLVILSVIKFNDIKFSSDLKEIEPKGLESLVINDILIDKFDFSNDITLGISKTLEHAHMLKEQAEDLDSVGFVESVTGYIPLLDKQIKRQKILKGIKKQAKSKLSNSLFVPQLKDEIKRLEDNIIEISDLAYIGGETKIVTKCDELINSNIISNFLNNINQNKKTLKRVQKIFISNLKKVIANTNSDKKITAKDLPENIKDTYIGKDGTFLTSIYPEGDVWNDRFQPVYINEIRSVPTDLTGTSIITLKVLEIAGKEGTRILLIVVFVIYLVLLIDFRSFKFATLAMIPMALTLVLLIGIMTWFGIKFNFVNIMALPIIIGIGVDDGVHIIHRYLLEKHLMPTVKSTGRSIFLTTITTMSAFGTLMISKYRGFASFGLILILGIALAYILTILLLSALIRITENRHPARDL
ncbi:RND family transporter [bacterium]